MTALQKRLAIFISHMEGGGAQRAMLNLAEGISRRGYAVDLVLARAKGPLVADVPNSVRVVDLKASRVLTSLPALTRYLRHEQPRAMVSALNYVNIIALLAWRLANVPTRLVVTERNQLSKEAAHASKWGMRLMPHLAKRFYPWADGIATVSKGVADDLAFLMGSSCQRIKVIYNPVVTPALKEKAHASLKHPWFERGQPPVILGVGRLSPQKGFATLIRAFSQVRQTRLARLLILGEGRERPMLEALVRELGLEQDVKLPGFTTNPYPYMSQASLFVLSSRWEGLPGALIEALYCGTPVISTDCPSGPREILKGGLYGQLVPVDDIGALAPAIEMALAGKAPHPPQESWFPFEEKAVVDQYINFLLAN